MSPLNGDVTVSFPSGAETVEVVAYNATAIRQLPKGSKIFSVEKQQSVLSRDLIVQAVQENWCPQQTVHLRLKVTTSTPSLDMFIRVAGKLKGRKELIFEPTPYGAYDQQGLPAEYVSIRSFSYSLPKGSKYFGLNTEGEVFEYRTTPKGIQSQLLLKLPPQVMEHSPKVLGIFDFDSDGTDEVFLEWAYERKRYDFHHHYQIYHKVAEGYVLLGDFELKGGPAVSSIKFITEPNPKQPRKVIFGVHGGAAWETYYLLRRDGKAADELCAASWLKEIDLNHDGIYELVFPSKHNLDKRCSYGILAFSYLEIFQWDGRSYQKRWPPEGWCDYVTSGTGCGGKNYQVMASLCDMDDDGDDEIVALTDTGEKGDKGRKLAIYKWSGEAPALISQIDVTSPYTAIMIGGIQRLRDGKQIVLDLADPQRCADDSQKGKPGEIKGGYTFKDGQLELAWLNESADIKIEGELVDCTH
jgi:hypothetical protein